MSRSPGSAGYSGTPLARKLGIFAGSRILARNAPPEYKKWLAPLPLDVTFEKQISAATDIVHIFCDRKAALKAELVRMRASIRVSAAIWVSWPKKASKLPTDITEDTVRASALPIGLVDVKVCAVRRDEPARIHGDPRMSKPVSPRSAAATLTGYWSPRVMVELDDSYVRGAKVKGSFAWHAHDQEACHAMLIGHRRILHTGSVATARTRSLGEQLRSL